jgi:HK97 family phage prohead protease
MDFSDFSFSIETKSGDDEAGSFTGIASTSDLDLQGDVIEPGAFGKVSKMLPMFRNHNPDQQLGGWTAFEQDGTKLKVKGQLDLEIAIARDTHSLLKKGFLTGISVGYHPHRDGVEYDAKTGIRHIKKALLVEASIVPIPANQKARIRSVKSLGALDSLASVSGWLRNSGFEDGEIDVIVNKGFAELFGTKRLPFTGIDDHYPLDVASVTTDVRALLSQLKGQYHV